MISVAGRAWEGCLGMPLVGTRIGPGALPVAWGEIAGPVVPIVVAVTNV